MMAVATSHMLRKADMCAVWSHLCCVQCGIWYVSCVVSFGHKPLDITNGCHSCGPNPICPKILQEVSALLCFSNVSLFSTVFLSVFLGVLRSVFLAVFLQCASRCVSRCAATKQMFWFLSSVLPLSRSVILTGAAEVGQNSATDRGVNEGKYCNQGFIWQFHKVAFWSTEKIVFWWHSHRQRGRKSKCRKIQQYCNMAGVSSSPNYNTNFTKLWTGWTDKFGFWLTKSEIWQRSDSSGWSNLIWNIRLMRVTKKERVGLVNRFGDSNKIHFEKNK